MSIKILFNDSYNLAIFFLSVSLLYSSKVWFGLFPLFKWDLYISTAFLYIIIIYDEITYKRKQNKKKTKNNRTFILYHRYFLSIGLVLDACVCNPERIIASDIMLTRYSDSYVHQRISSENLILPYIIESCLNRILKSPLLGLIQ